jgi:hypothetical protein
MFSIFSHQALVGESGKNNLEKQMMSIHVHKPKGIGALTKNRPKGPM